MPLEEDISEILFVPKTGALEASSKWAGKTRNCSTSSKKWVGKCLFSIKVKQKSGLGRDHLAHPAPTPLNEI